MVRIIDYNFFFFKRDTIIIYGRFLFRFSMFCPVFSQHDIYFFSSHCKKFNVEICVKLGTTLMSITIKILKLKKIIFTVANQRNCQECQKYWFLHTEIICNPTQYDYFSDRNTFVFMFWVSLGIETLTLHGN